MLDVVALAEELIDIPSVSGDEGPVMDHVVSLLGGRGWTVRTQEVTPGRNNVWASRAGGDGGVTLSTHLDTVPPHLPSRRSDGRLYGRGACDAKGTAAAMICAADRLSSSGENGVDLLFVVGEEAGSDGALAANELPASSRYLVNGEPTGGKLASGAKGSLRVLVKTEGRSAHSAYPQLGSSAIDAMVALLAELDGLEWPADDVLGATTLNVGVLRGGTAANVIPAECVAEVLVRLVGDEAPVREALDAWAAGSAVLEYGATVPAQRLHTVPGFDSAPVAFTSDAALLGNWGEALMYGPGSIHHAHTVEEHVETGDLVDAVDVYERLVRTLLGS